MYWESGGRTIFWAHYLDGEITKVSDTRSSTATSPWRSEKSRRSSGTTSTRSFDPDSHDIESFDYDYGDEYDDYDEALEGFLDDEDMWDDY